MKHAFMKHALVSHKKLDCRFVLLAARLPRIFSKGEAHSERFRVKMLAQAVLRGADKGDVPAEADGHPPGKPVVLQDSLSADLPHALEPAQSPAIDNLDLGAGFRRNKQMAVNFLIADRHIFVARRRKAENPKKIYCSSDPVMSHPSHRGLRL